MDSILMHLIHMAHFLQSSSDWFMNELWPCWRQPYKYFSTKQWQGNLHDKRSHMAVAQEVEQCTLRYRAMISVKLN